LEAVRRACTPFTAPPREADAPFVGAENETALLTHPGLIRV
jgi:hypothetical protein